MGVESPDFSRSGEREFEKKETEHIPTEEEVHQIFQELIGWPYEVVRKCEDEKGLYLLEVTAPGDSGDEIIEYSYMRAGRYPEGQASDNRIDKIFYRSGTPVGGESVEKQIDGKWKRN